MTKLLFETCLSGHRMEYIHHLYMGMAARPETDYVIVVPREFEAKKKLYKWLDSNNVKFIFLKDSEVESVENAASPLKGSWEKTRLLRHYVKETNSSSVFLITLMEFMPFLPFMISRKINVSGIIYLIYLYRWKNSSFARRVGDVLKYAIMSRNNCVKRVFVLNDEVAARRINALYKTDKFRYLPDPYNALDYQPKDIREEMGIPSGSKMFLHFGGLGRRKGTLVILQALEQMSEEERKGISLVFAGRVYDDIKDEFYAMVEELNKMVQIKVFDQFCSNELLADLCHTCDCILMPYSQTAQSSGLLGHAAHYGKSVIGPSTGLVGKLIRRNKLGMTIKNITPESLAKAMLQNVSEFKPSVRYRDTIEVNRFVKCAFDRF